jgi:hypothetical protein
MLKNISIQLHDGKKIEEISDVKRLSFRTFGNVSCTGNK